MTTTTTNGQIRKSLADQIDRLDNILDGLADGLNEAVAESVKQAVGVAVKEAVQTVLTEVLTNPDILNLFRGFITPPAATVSPTIQTGSEDRLSLRERMASIRDWAANQARAAGSGAAQGVAVAGKALSRVGGGLLGLWRLRTRLLATVGLGAAVGLGAYLAGPWISTAVGGAAGLAVGLFTSARAWIQRTFVGYLFAQTTS